jgi:hypothetical protein
MKHGLISPVLKTPQALKMPKAETETTPVSLWFFYPDLKVV